MKKNENNSCNSETIGQDERVTESGESIMNKVEKLALKIGAEITKVATDDGWQIEVSAPDGFGWGGVGTLIAHYGGTWGNIKQAWEDLQERMMMQLSPKH